MIFRKRMFFAERGQFFTWYVEGLTVVFIDIFPPESSKIR
jgi:hypothetical protein